MAKDKSKVEGVTEKKTGEERKKKTLVDKLIACKNKTITDEVFLLIQENRDYMQEYLELVHKNGKNDVNNYIGKQVKDRYDLKNSKRRNSKPRSTLIKSHQEFE
jgi:hypothetical protein